MTILLILVICVLATQAATPAQQGYDKKFNSENKQLLKKWSLFNKNLELDSDEGTSRETIEWTQVCGHHIM
jgi:hypothetical protein